MKNKRLLSIAIPTYNREKFLKELFENLELQIAGIESEVEICVSNNGSADNTKRVVFDFSQKHPGLVKYGENDKNLGFDKNVLKAVALAQGEFIWTFSDDDLFNEGALKYVFNFIKEKKKAGEIIGGLVVKDSSWQTDEASGKKVKYHSSVIKEKPEIYQADFTEILQGGVPYTGISALIFNGALVKRMLEDCLELVQPGLGSHYFHAWLYLVMMILNKEAVCWVINKDMMVTFDVVPRFKLIMEDHFELVYRGYYKFFNDMLVVAKGADEKIIAAITKERNDAVFSIIGIMAQFKAFKIPTWSSWKRCLNLAFEYFPFFKAVLIAGAIIALAVTPSTIIEKFFKICLKIKFGKKADAVWLDIYTQFTCWNQRDGIGLMAKEG